VGELMIHKDDCDCVNCVAKGKPIREIFIRDVTAKDLAEIEVFDCLEGYGQISSVAEQKFIRKYGFLLVKMLDNRDNHILRSCGINADGWICFCQRCGKKFGARKDADSTTCKDTAVARLKYIEDLEDRILKD